MSLDVDGIVAALVDRGDTILKAGAKELAGSLKKNLTKKSGVPSEPGEYPAKQSGELVKSISVDRRRVGKSVSYEVSVDAEYAEPLEAIRPFFQRTVDENEQRIEDAMDRADR